MNVYLSIRTESDLGVRYDPAPPGQPHKGAVSLAMPAGGVFFIFSSPARAIALGEELAELGEQWARDLGADTDGGRHSEIVASGTETAANLPVYPNPQALLAQVADIFQPAPEAQ